MGNSESRSSDPPRDNRALTAAEFVMATTPFAGGGAVLVNRIRLARLQRFLEDKLELIEATMAKLQARLGEDELAKRLDTDEYIAAAARTWDAMCKEPNPDRLDQLRNALVNGYILERSVRDRRRFLDLVERLDPDDISGLASLVKVEKNHEDVIRGADRIVADAVGIEQGDHRSFVVLRHLVAEGLLSEHHEERVEALNVSVPKVTTNLPRPQGVQRIYQYTIPQIARDFLAQLSDPEFD